MPRILNWPSAPAGTSVLSKHMSGHWSAWKTDFFNRSRSRIRLPVSIPWTGTDTWIDESRESPATWTAASTSVKRPPTFMPMKFLVVNPSFDLDRSTRH